MVNVTKENFIEQTNDFLKHLPSAAFVAIDEEMTGIQIPGSTGRPPKDQTPTERYEQLLKHVPERYSIIQLGVCLFHHHHHVNGDGNDGLKSPPSSATTTTPPNAAADQQQSTSSSWHVRKYNFFLFPSPNGQREVTLNPGAIHFLQSHNLSLDVWASQGIHFETEAQAKQTLEQFLTKERQLQAAQAAAAANIPTTVDGTIRRRCVISRQDDVEFFARAMASLREWLDAAHQQVPQNNARQQQQQQGVPPLHHGNSFLLPACNSFLRRCLYEAIGKEYPDLILESAAPEHANQIRVLRLNHAERALRTERLRIAAWRKCLEQVGMWRVLDALRRVCHGHALPRHHVLFAESVANVDWNFVDDYEYDGYDEQQQDDDKKPAAAAVATPPATPTRKKSSNNNNKPVPIVVHNGLMDLLFLLTHFRSPTLPDTWQECKHWISRYFPVVYDTKVLASEYHCSGNRLGGAGNNNNTMVNPSSTTLGVLFDKLVKSHAPTRDCFIDTAVVQEEPEDGEIEEPAANAAAAQQEHEAAYDAYMTGAIFVALTQDIAAHYHRLDTALQEEKKQERQLPAADGDTAAATEATAQTALVPPSPSAATAAPTAESLRQNENGGEKKPPPPSSSNFLQLEYLLGAFNRISGSKPAAAAATTKRREPTEEERREAAAYASLQRLIRSRYGRNKIFQMQSMYTIDLEQQGEPVVRPALSTGEEGEEVPAAPVTPGHPLAPDPAFVEEEETKAKPRYPKLEDPLKRGMSPHASFYVAKIDSRVSTRDIVMCLQNLQDPDGRRIHFDILWIDDTTFIVSVSHRYLLMDTSVQHAAAAPPQVMATTASTLHETERGAEQAILRQQGALVYSALRQRFPTEEIMTLADYFRHKEARKKLQEYEEQAAKAEAEAPAPQQESWLDTIRGIWGLASWLTINDGHHKRQRTYSSDDDLIVDNKRHRQE